MIEDGTGLHTAERDGVVVVTVDRPPANAMSRPLLRSIASLFETYRSSHDPRPVVITGAGERFFSAGGDIKELDGAGVDELCARVQEFHDMLVAMDRYPRPVVAAVNGYCVGGGLEYAMFADVVLAVPHAEFGFPEIKHGLLPAEKGIQRVSRLIGMRAARELLLGGHLIDVECAAELGLVDAIVDQSVLLDVAIARARGAGDNAPVLYAALKRALNDFDDTNDERSSELTLAHVGEYFDDPVASRLRHGWGPRSRSGRSE